MGVLLKNGTECEIPQDWIDEWNKVYYDVPRTLAQIRIWCLDNPSKRKTKRGIRAFLGRWIRTSCQLRPVLSRNAVLQYEERPVETLETRRTRIAELKGALK